ncbi:MAG: MFS transporter [Magnetococcales bacterium]|nr:MFS transporter [Magnetococcales bacterium]
MAHLNAYLSLAGFYTFYFATLGIWMPYWPLYMAHVGHTPAAIGLLTSLAMAVRLLGPPIWGRLADRSDSRKKIILLTSTGALCASGLLLLGSHLALLTAGVALLHFFLVGCIALVETTAMETVTRHGWDYGRIRLWGSSGFILLALGLGPLADRWGLILVPVSITLLLLLQTLTSIHLPDSETLPSNLPAQSFSLFRPRKMLWFNLMGLLMLLSHGAYYGFMSIHLETHGFSKTAIGALWALGVVAEIAILAGSNGILKRFSVSTILTTSLFLAALRWSIYSTTLSWPWLILGQTLHAFTFGTFHIAAIRRVYETSPPRCRATAQSWFASISYGAGLGSGLLLAGWLYTRIGAQSLFALMAAIALVGTLASLRSARLFTLDTLKISS